jgi:pentose-5-phosphate-3-epimerase
MDKLDVILLMSVNPGFGGQSFIPQTLDKLREVRQRIDASGYDIRLEVDGGVQQYWRNCRGGCGYVCCRFGDFRSAGLQESD